MISEMPKQSNTQLRYAYNYKVGQESLQSFKHLLYENWQIYLNQINYK